MKTGDAVTSPPSSEFPGETPVTAVCPQGLAARLGLSPVPGTALRALGTPDPRSQRQFQVEAVLPTFRTQAGSFGVVSLTPCCDSPSHPPQPGRDTAPEGAVVPWKWLVT